MDPIVLRTASVAMAVAIATRFPALFPYRWGWRGSLFFCDFQSPSPLTATRELIACVEEAMREYCRREAPISCYQMMLENASVMAARKGSLVGSPPERERGELVQLCELEGKLFFQEGLLLPGCGDLRESLPLCCLPLASGQNGGAYRLIGTSFPLHKQGEKRPPKRSLLAEEVASGSWERALEKELITPQGVLTPRMASWLQGLDSLSLLSWSDHLPPIEQVELPLEAPLVSSLSALSSCWLDEGVQLPHLFSYVEATVEESEEPLWPLWEGTSVAERVLFLAVDGSLHEQFVQLITRALQATYQLHEAFGVACHWRSGAAAMVRSRQAKQKAREGSQLLQAALAPLLEKSMGTLLEPSEARVAGPYLELMGRDRFGHLWPMAGLQLLVEEAAAAEPGKPLVHRLLLRSYSSRLRSCAFLLERESLPFHLVPEQLRLLVEGEPLLSRAHQLVGRMRREGWRASYDARSSTLKEKVWRAERAKVPYIVVLRQKEAASAQLALRREGGRVEWLEEEQLLLLMQKELSEQVDRH